MSEAIEFVSPVGRWIQGSIWTPNTTDKKGAPLVFKTGANAGQPREDYYFGIAIAKDNPDLGAFYALLTQAAQSSFPGGQFNLPTFRWKFLDGDTALTGTGQPYNQREGFAGHFVFQFGSSFKPTVYAQDAASVMIDPASVKRGYFVRVIGNVAGNGDPADPGLYLNHNFVQFMGFGPEIHFGPDGAALLAAAPVAHMPVGMSAAPIAGAIPAAPVIPGVAPVVPTQAAPVLGAPAAVAAAPVAAAIPTAPVAAVAGVVPGQPNPAILTPGVHGIPGQ